jgi:hypothetical protein
VKIVPNYGNIPHYGNQRKVALRNHQSLQKLKTEKLKKILEQPVLRKVQQRNHRTRNNKSSVPETVFNPYTNEGMGPYFKKHLSYMAGRKTRRNNQSLDGYGMLKAALADPGDGSPSDLELKSALNKNLFAPPDKISEEKQRQDLIRSYEQLALQVSIDKNHKDGVTKEYDEPTEFEKFSGK